MTVTLAALEGSLIFAAVCEVLLRFGSAAPWPGAAWPLSQALAVTAACTIAAYYNGLYDPRLARSLARIARRLPGAAAVAVVLVAAVGALVPEAGLASELLVAGVLVGLLLQLAGRALVYPLVRRRPFGLRVLILGATSLTEKLIAEIEARPHANLTIVGVVGDGALRPPARYPVLGPRERLGTIVETLRPDRIVVALRERRGQLAIGELLESRARGIVVEDAAEVYERLTGKLAIEWLVPSSLVFSRSFGGTRLDPVSARLVSLVVAAVALVAVAPLLGLIALAIKCDSRGPVLFVQERVGKGGRHFRFFKFRSMHPAAGRTSEWARDNGDRITRAGRWLRRFRLDELPQLVNVIRGDMNLVGPRPHPVSNYDLFARAIPYYPLRLALRPGITGWAQVRYGYANGLEEEIEKMRYDLYYVKHRSLAFDLRILVDTVKVVGLGLGAGVRDRREMGALRESERAA